eukprot:COSAG01_NODE_1137_length_11546_cov_14.463091_2_plen_58_part_00
MGLRLLHDKRLVRSYRYSLLLELATQSHITVPVQPKGSEEIPSSRSAWLLSALDHRS